MTTVLINLNNETGEDIYSVEPENDVGNWIDSFNTLIEAINFVEKDPNLQFVDNFFRDTRTR